MLGSALAEKTHVYGLARGGLPIADEVARGLEAPLGGIAVAEIGHPHHPELALGAITADGPPALTPRGGGLSKHAGAALDVLVANAETEARELDSKLHRQVMPLAPEGAVCVLVGDALLRSAPLIAACRWALKHGAAQATVAAPVATPRAMRELTGECEAIVVPVVRDDLARISVWRHDRAEMSTTALAQLLAGNRASLDD